jgi:hypothetical protein
VGTTTFTGPIRAGNIINTSGTTLGRDIANVGYVMMAQSQSFTQAASTGQSAGLYLTNIVIPANSQIIGIDILVTAAWSGAAQTVNVGISATATELAVAADNDLSTTLGNKAIIPGNNATRVGNWKDTGTADDRIWVLSTNTGTGAGVITVRYIQNNNLT